MNNPVVFNVNEYVSVRIKPEGFAYWKARHDALFKDMPQLQRPLAYYEAQAGPNGRVEMQMHEFMRVFGDVSMGFAPPYETDIWVSADKLTPPEVFAVYAGAAPAHA